MATHATHASHPARRSAASKKGVVFCSPPATFGGGAQSLCLSARG